MEVFQEARDEFIRLAANEKDIFAYIHLSATCKRMHALNMTIGIINQFECIGRNGKPTNFGYASEKPVGIRKGIKAFCLLPRYNKVLVANFKQRSWINICGWQRKGSYKFNKNTSPFVKKGELRKLFHRTDSSNCFLCKSIKKFLHT